MLVSIESDSIQKSNEQNKSAWLWIIAALDEFEDTAYGENDGFHWKRYQEFKFCKICLFVNLNHYDHCGPIRLFVIRGIFVLSEKSTWDQSQWVSEAS